MRDCEKSGSMTMHIRLLAAEFPPISYAGLATYSYNVAQHLKRNNSLEVSVLVNHYPMTPYVSNLNYVCTEIRKIAQLRKTERIDVVYAITFRPEFLLVGLYAKTLGIPFVAHGVGLDVYSRNPLFVHARKLTYSISERLVCGASFQKEMISNEGAPREKVHVVLGGVDAEVFQPMHNDRHNFRLKFNVEDKFVLLSLGRLVRRKGFKDAVKALAHLSDIDDIVLFIVGEGPETPSLEKQVQDLSLHEKVKFLGFVPTCDLPAIYNAADLFVAPFKAIGKDMEGTPLVIQEALSCGIPVVSTNTAGVPELIEDGKNGFTVDVSSPQRIAEKIRMLYEDPKLRAKMAIEARKRAQELLDWKVAVGKTERVLSEALASTKKR